MQVGNLNKRISLESPTQTSDGMGSFTTTWTVEAESIPAAIWPVSAAETIRSAAPTMVITHRIRIRYRAGIRTGWRIEFDGTYFDIVSGINVKMSHRWLDILAKEAD